MGRLGDVSVHCAVTGGVGSSAVSDMGGVVGVERIAGAEAGKG